MRQNSSQLTKHWGLCATAIACLFVAGNACAAASSALYSKGYTVIPQPQEVALRGTDFRFEGGWQLSLGDGIRSNDVAVETLTDGLASRFHLNLEGANSHSTGGIRLSVMANSVAVGEAGDRNKSALEEQAYKLNLTSSEISITANAATGMLYGVETLLQLLKVSNGGLWLPEGEIVDWPDLELRTIYWDDAHHLEKMEVLKDAIRQAAFFKINGVAIKLEGHFQFKSAPAIVEPYALSPSQLQELTDFGLRYHVQLIPYLDVTSHLSFILKHPEYAKLRAFSESNYEICTTNPDAYKLLDQMFQDLLEANKGGKFFFLSNDEPYYVGLVDNPQCHEASHAKELGSAGRVLAEFLTRTAGFLHDRGREVIFWGEDPLAPGDIPTLPSYLISSGEAYGPVFDPVFKAQGIREMIYINAHGNEPLFPEYYVLPKSERLHRPPGTRPFGWFEPFATGGRVREMFDHISFTAARHQSDSIGVYIPGWNDEGIHPESYWLGYVAGTAYGWHPGTPGPEEVMNEFYSLFYGPGARDMGRIYQLMCFQAQFWVDSWETQPSNARKRIFNYPPGTDSPAQDQTLPLPAVPTPEFLNLSFDWIRANTERLRSVSRFLVENDELLDLLEANLRAAEFNRYNLEVFTSQAQLYRQNLLLLQEMGHLSELLEAAQSAAAKANAASAVAALDQALDLVERVRQERNSMLRDLTETWYKSWLPRVMEANGRHFLDEVDDVKDQPPSRTVDMSYLVYRELLLPFGQWVEEVQVARNRYATAHSLPVRRSTVNWGDTKTLLSQEQVP